jgi:CTP:molybdopterin cytidylyltransferase MocA
MIAAIILADPDIGSDGTPVALRAWEGGASLIEWQIAQVQAAGVEVIVVVVGPYAERLIPLVSGDDVEPIVNDRWPAGEAASVRVGAIATPRNTTTAVIVWIARPRDEGTLRAVLDEHLAAGARVTRLFSGDAPGSPVCVDADVLARLRNLSDGAEIEDVLRSYDTLVVRQAGDLPDLAR